ncbi:MAG: hypothetical protein WA837_11375 [Xanthobacteraceae bacterium]
MTLSIRAVIAHRRLQLILLPQSAGYLLCDFRKVSSARGCSLDLTPWQRKNLHLPRYKIGHRSRPRFGPEATAARLYRAAKERGKSAHKFPVKWLIHMTNL